MIAGIVVELWMFVLRLSHSGKAVHIACGGPSPDPFASELIR